MKVLNETMQEMFQYIRDGGQVGILDGSSLSHNTRGYNSETALNDFHQRIQYQLKE